MVDSKSIEEPSINKRKFTGMDTYFLLVLNFTHVSLSILPERFILDCIAFPERYAFAHVYTFISYDLPRRKCLRPDGHLLFCIADKGG